MHDAAAQVDSVVGLDEFQGRFVGVIGKVAEDRFGVGVVQGPPPPSQGGFIGAGGMDRPAVVEHGVARLKGNAHFLLEVLFGDPVAELVKPERAIAGGQGDVAQAARSVRPARPSR